MIELLFPVKSFTLVEIKASFAGFCYSTKCFLNSFLQVFGKKHSPICTDEMLQCRMNCSTEQTLMNQADLVNYIDKVFICSKITAKILILLFHFYSEIREKNTIYRLGMKNKNEYIITWNLSDRHFKEELQNNWLRKEVFNLSARKIIHKFSLLYDCTVEYSTIKSDETEDEPIKTRLILLSCGHQLGLELVDVFCEYFLSRKTEPAICYICREPIWIVGSYDAIVYKCRDERNK
jgi:hypothetical protein